MVCVCVAPPIEYAWCQFKMTSLKCPYRSKHQLILLTVRHPLQSIYYYRPETLHITQNKHGEPYSFKTKYLFFTGNFNSTRITIIPNSGGGLRWFVLVWLHLSVFTAYRPKFWWWFAVICCGFGGVWWFAVVCGNLRWFAMVCGGLPFSHTDYIDTANTFGICTLYMYNKTASHANKYANTVQHPMAMKGSEIFRSHTDTHTHTRTHI